MVKVEETYDAFFRIWNTTTMIPRLIPQAKWFKEGSELKPGDIIYFQKVENELSSTWTVGQVYSVTRSRDGVVRSNSYESSLNRHQWRWRSHGLI